MRVRTSSDKVSQGGAVWDRKARDRYLTPFSNFRWMRLRPGSHTIGGTQ
jgi:hypothetical protein